MATVADVQSHDLFDNDDHCSTFWRGRLYVQCQNGFVLRINPSSGTYHLVKQPMGAGGASKYPQFYLGKSKAGVYFASVISYKCRLQVWHLDESCYREPAWVLRCDKNLGPLLQPWRSYRERARRRRRAMAPAVPRR
ncbi:hypothetical protein C2845_PM02G05280 [Panicum miliaceum]|uniref:F-box protein n=1 Tax=Panicum miliaceum TaxID=4540 RepID=A0A3L6SBN3_PANMI|nr:hypothetical protein C2845_PM02G05280 [Panicum miliaceum]